MSYYNLDNVQKTFINSNSILIETTGTLSNNLFLTEDITIYDTNIINLTENVTGSVQYNNYTTVNNVLGSQGYRGPQGDSNGSQGFMGFQGIVGIQGGLGYQGVQGVQGDMGFQGNQGYIGNQGPIGNQGHIGKQMVIFAYTGDLNGVSTSDSNIGQYAVVNKDLYVYNGTGFVLCTQLFRENEGAGVGNRGAQGDIGVQGYMGFQGVAGGGSVSYNSYTFTGLNGLLYFDETNVLNGSRIVNNSGSSIITITPYATKSTGYNMPLSNSIEGITEYVPSWTGYSIPLFVYEGTGNNLSRTIPFWSEDGLKFQPFYNVPTGNWTSFSYSANKQYQTMIERGNGMYRIMVSNDYGQTFSSKMENTAGPYWNVCCVSENGQYQIAATSRLSSASWGTNPGVYVSSDYGNNWTIKLLAGDNTFNRVRMSSSGQYIIVHDSQYGTWFSNNYGENWSRKTNFGFGAGVCISNSGQYIYYLAPSAQFNVGNLFRSSDYGQTFTQIGSLTFPTIVGCSSGGDKIIARIGAVDTGLSISNDYGETWSSINYPSYPGSVIAKNVFHSNDLKMIVISGINNTSGSEIKTNAYISYDYGTNWRALNKNIGIVMSFDGTRQTVVNNLGTMFVSLNSATSFSNIANGMPYPISNYNDIASDADGIYQAAVGLYITTSSDSGLTWVNKGSIRDWRGVAVSYGWGTYQTAVAYNDYIYRSSDYGATFSPVESVRNWNSVSIDYTGQYQTAVVFGGQIYTSSDYGVTWTARDTNRNWKKVSVSYNGQYQTAIVNNGYIYTSSDYGVTWTQRDSQRYWNYICVTDNLQVACASNFDLSIQDYIYISRNKGVTWEPYDEKDYWSCVAISFNNLTMTAFKDSDYTRYRFSFTDTVPIMLIDNGTRRIGLSRTTLFHLVDMGTDFARKLTTTTWLVDSDQRVKENIEDADLDLCYNNVNNMNLRRFKWKEEFYPEVTDRNSVGFIAQEVEQVFPKSVLKADEEINNQFISDFRTLDANQIYKSMYGCLQKCIFKLEDLKNRQKNL